MLLSVIAIVANDPELLTALLGARSSAGGGGGAPAGISKSLLSCIICLVLLKQCDSDVRVKDSAAIQLESVLGNFLT